MTSVQTRYLSSSLRSSSLPVRYVLLLSVNHLKYFLNPTRKKNILIYFSLFYASPSKGVACENIRFSSLFAAGDVSSPRNVPSGKERGETDVFAGYQRCKFWTLLIGSEPSMLVANSNAANLRGSETGVKPLVTTPLPHDLCLLAVYRKYDNIIMISSLTVGARNSFFVICS